MYVTLYNLLSTSKPKSQNMQNEKRQFEGWSFIKNETGSSTYN